MDSTETNREPDINASYLTAALAWLRLRFEWLKLKYPLPSQPNQESPQKISLVSKIPEPPLVADQSPSLNDQIAYYLAEMSTAESQSETPALITLAKRMGLSRFEQDVLLLCVAMELDTRIAALCAQAQDDDNRPYPTFALAFVLFDEPSWDILSPERPLRYFLLIEINQPTAQPLTTSSLRADERIVNYIKGLHYLDDRLVSLIIPLDIDGQHEKLTHPQETLVKTITHQLEHAETFFPVIQLVGSDTISKPLVANQVAQHLHSQLLRIPIEMFPQQPADLEFIARLWSRESLLMPLALYLDAEGSSSSKEQIHLVNRFLAHSEGLFFLGTQKVWSRIWRTSSVIEVANSTQTLIEERISDISSQPTLTPSLSTKSPSLNQQVSQELNEISPSRKEPFYTQERPSGLLIRISLSAYGASLVMTGVVIPIVASLIAVGLYLTLPGPLLFAISPTSPWYTFVNSGVLTGLIWLVAALPYCYFTSAQYANFHSYRLLRSRLNQLKARLQIREFPTTNKYIEITDLKKFIEDADWDVYNEHQRVSLQKAYVACIEVSRMLFSSPAGLHWSLGSGYNSAWQLIHQAEELMIVVEDVETVLRGSIHDYLKLQGSSINGKDALLGNLLQAVKELRPDSIVYFKDFQSQLSDQQNDLSDLVNRISNTNTNRFDKNDSRLVLQEVRSRINKFRDQYWLGLVTVRNQLLAYTMITGIVTYTLVTLSTLISPPNTGRDGILWATLFYMVGAFSGLYTRLYAESQSASAMDDFGFSKARLIATPFLSGLAGIGGVLITYLVANTLISEKSFSLSTLFTADPRLLLVAAIFGITPNFFIQGLQRKMSNSKTKPQSNKTAKGSRLTDQQLHQIDAYEINRVRQWLRTSIIAAVIGFIVFLSGIIILFTWNNTLLGVVILLSGIVPEIASALSYRQSKIISSSVSTRMFPSKEAVHLVQPNTPSDKQKITTSSSSH